jgi:hypothetical protein
MMSTLWQSEDFLLHNNPRIDFPFISFSDEDPSQYEQCNTTILSKQFPHVIDKYPNNQCQMQLWIANLTDFQINTGRFYAVDNNLTVHQLIQVLDEQDNKTVVFAIELEIPLSNLYVSVS